MNKLLQPVTELDATAPIPSHRFTACTESEAEKWQAKARFAVAESLGVPALDDVDFSETQIFRVDRPGFLHQKFTIRTAEHSATPLHLLTPSRVLPGSPVVLTYCGHGLGVNDIVGLWEDDSERNVPDGYQSDFSISLCRRGFTVVAPEIAGFGERQNDFSYLDRKMGEPEPTTCHLAALTAIMQGRSLNGLRVRDMRRVLDWILERNISPSGRVGVMGISGGGMLAMYHSALDERISAVVLSGYLSTYRMSILNVFHCPCNYAPGLAAIIDMPDVASLILPRPLHIESGTRDCIFPVAATKEAFSRVLQASQLLGGGDKLSLDIFEGRHRINGNPAFEFLSKHLVATPKNETLH